MIFTPWLHGNRSPFEDSRAGAMFFNIRLENGKRDMLRAVLEGICYHLRWLLECEAKKVQTSDPIRFVGGGALSPLTCQVLADITGRTIETIDNTQSVGAMGAALTVAAGIRGVDVLELSCRLVKANHTYIPDPGNKEIYERNYQVFKRLYRDNAAAFRMLNSLPSVHPLPKKYISRCSDNRTAFFYSTGKISSPGKILWYNTDLGCCCLKTERSVTLGGR